MPLDWVARRRDNRPCQSIPRRRFQVGFALNKLTKEPSRLALFTRPDARESLCWKEDAWQNYWPTHDPRRSPGGKAGFSRFPVAFGILGECYFSSASRRDNWAESLARVWRIVEKDMGVQKVFTTSHDPEFEQKFYEDFLTGLGYIPEPHAPQWWSKTIERRRVGTVSAQFVLCFTYSLGYWLRDESWMDARGVQRLLEKIHGLAETATMVGAKTSEAMLHEPRLSDRLKQQLLLIYREEALRRTRLSAAMGLAICRALEPELDDATACDRWAFFCRRFQTLYKNAQADLEKEFPESSALEPPSVK